MTKNTINGDYYDGRYSRGITPTPSIKSGDRFYSTESCDDRQWDDIKRVAKENNLDLFYCHDEEDIWIAE